MSADYWVICPRCVKRRDAAHTKVKEEVRESYGKVPAEEFVHLLEKSDRWPELDTTLREDYELGVDDSGWFECRYSCYCTDCDFGYSFKHGEQLDL